VPLMAVDPLERIEIGKDVTTSSPAERVSVHLQDSAGADRGSFGEVRVQPTAEVPVR
jgi:hypothetical protein